MTSNLANRLRRIASGEWTLKGDEGWLEQAAALLDQRDDQRQALHELADALQEQCDGQWVIRTRRDIAVRLRQIAEGAR